MNEIDTYITALEPYQAAIVKELRALLATNFPQLKEEYKWSQPVYTFNGKDVAYILATKQGANFGLTDGAQLSDPKKLLEGAGKSMRHVKVHSLESLDQDYIKQLITQALQGQ